MEQANLNEVLQTYRNKWRSTIKNGGQRGDGTKSYLHPIISVILESNGNRTEPNKGSMSVKKFMEKNFHILSASFQERGRAILGLGLTDTEIEEIVDILEIDSEELFKEMTPSVLLLYPELRGKKEDEIMKKFGKKISHLVLQSKYSGTAMSLFGKLFK